MVFEASIKSLVSKLREALERVSVTKAAVESGGLEVASQHKRKIKIQNFSYSTLIMEISTYNIMSR